MQRRTIVVATILVIGIVVGGYVVLTNLGSKPSEPLTGADALPSSNGLETSTQEQVRDAAMTFIDTNHIETKIYITNLEWTGGKVETGLVGAEKYVYESTHGDAGGQWWTVEINYPVVLNPTYTVTANYTQSGVLNPANIAWKGTWTEGTISEESYSSNINQIVVPTQQQARDDIMAYIGDKHPETKNLMANLEWTGGRVDAGVVGSEKYVYETSHGEVGGQWWTVEMNIPVVPNPLYTVTVNYTQAGVLSPYSVDWQGTWQSGTIIETSFSSNVPKT